jgi:hypothetical protein
MEPLAPSGALYALLNYRYGLFCGTEQQIVAEYRQLSQVANAVPTRRLRRADDFRSLPNTVSTILEDLETDDGGQ